MNKVFGILGLILLFSCQKNKSEINEVSDQISVSLDTILVDSGDEFLFLRDFLSNSSLDASTNFLYNFNEIDFSLEKIDLDKLKLVDKIKFEKDGPNGLGTGRPKFTLAANGNFLIWDYSVFKEFDQNGNLVRNLNLEEIAPDYLKGSENYPLYLFEDPKRPNRILVPVLNWENYSYFLLDIDLEKDSFDKIPLPEMEKFKDYRVVITNDGIEAGGFGGSVYRTFGDGKVLLNNNAFNEVHFFDFSNDSLLVIKWETQLLGAKRGYIPPKSVEGFNEEFTEIEKLTNQDISYKKILWDNKNKRYLRFSEKKKIGEEKDKFGNYKQVGGEVFLSVFDRKFDLIAEARILGVDQLPNTYFIKNGEVWFYENINDELAFVKMKIEID